MRPIFFCCLDIYIIGNSSLNAWTNKFWVPRGKSDRKSFINQCFYSWVSFLRMWFNRISNLICTYIESINLIIFFEWYQPLGETHIISYVCVISVCERKATQIQKHEENEQWVTSTAIASIRASTWNEHNCINIASYMLAYCLWSFSSTLSHLIYGKTCELCTKMVKWTGH